MLEQGVPDPVKVTRSAVQNAVSIASMILTTDALITDIPEDKPVMPMGGGGGMRWNGRHGLLASRMLTLWVWGVAITSSPTSQASNQRTLQDYSGGFFDLMVHTPTTNDLWSRDTQLGERITVAYLYNLGEIASAMGRAITHCRDASTSHVCHPEWSEEPFRTRDKLFAPLSMTLSTM